MIYVTGDTHGFEFSKLNTKNFPQQKQMTKNDYVIICGDFGLIWNNSNESKYWIKWLTNKNFTTLFISGNHENFDLLNSYKVENWNGGKVHKINNSIIHLMTGYVFNINDKNIFTFGGAKSVDKEFRKEHISWWKEEMPEDIEYIRGLSNLAKNGNNVDYILSHTCPSIIIPYLTSYPEYDELTDFLNKLYYNVQFKHWYFGHFHQNFNNILNNNITALYHNIKLL